VSIDEQRVVFLELGRADIPVEERVVVEFGIEVGEAFHTEQRAPYVPGERDHSIVVVGAVVANDEQYVVVVKEPQRESIERAIEMQTVQIRQLIIRVR